MKNALCGLMLGCFFLSIRAEFELTGADLYYGEPSENYIMRWHFQALCNHVFDPRTYKWAWPTSTQPGGARFDPRDVKPGDLIFVRDVPLFFEEVHPLIQQPYIMVTHGEFRDTCEDSYLNYLEDEKIIAWFGIHPCKMGHHKYYPLPLGVAQDPKPLSDNKRKRMNTLFKDLREKTVKKKLVYLNFSDDENVERQHLRKLLNGKTFCSTQVTRLPFNEYLQEMAQYKFALSPRGWGPDCYRTWEALLVGTIPIVRRGVHDKLDIRAKRRTSQLDILYRNLPVLVVDHWEEITQEFLERKYREITAKQYDITRLYVEYWYEKMNFVRDAYFNEIKRSKKIR